MRYAPKNSYTDQFKESQYRILNLHCIIFPECFF